MDAETRSYIDSQILAERIKAAEDLVEADEDLRAHIKAEVESVDLSHQTFDNETKRVVMELQKKVAELDARLCELE